MKTYIATATREGKWWAICVTTESREVWTQSKGLDRVEDVAREAVSMALGVGEDSFDIEVRPELPEGFQTSIVTAQAKIMSAEEALASARQELRGLLFAMKDRGLSVRDLGVLFALSPQRISQLLAEPYPASEQEAAVQRTASKARKGNVSVTAIAGPPKSASYKVLRNPTSGTMKTATSGRSGRTAGSTKSAGSR